jgi:ankyrin repeat protein
LLLTVGAGTAAVDVTGKTALIYAVGRGFTAAAKRILDAGAGIDQRGGHDLTALSWAAGHSNDVPESEALATLELLLGAGATLDLTDDRGRTPLMIAAARGNRAMVRRLLEAGADRELRDHTGLTAFSLAPDPETRFLLQ